MNSKSKGDIAVGAAIKHYLSRGYEVCLPIGNKRAYDLIVEKNNKTYKVQVKFAGLYKRGRCIVALRITGGNQSYNYAKEYASDDFDILFAHTQRGEDFEVPWRDIDSRNELAIETSKYTKYKVS